MSTDLSEGFVSTVTDPILTHSATVTGAKVCKLSELEAGQTARILRVGLPELGCRKRFAELGLATGMSVTVTTTGDTMMLALGGGRMGLAKRCADCISVMKIST